jgi:hypothetical protein
MNSRLKKEWKENWPKLIIELIFLTVVGGLILFALTYFITEQLKPETDISVGCEIKKGINANYTVDIYFDNKASFAGDDFYIYIWGITSSIWNSNFSVSEQCRRIQELDIDSDKRFKIFCEFIPPKSKTVFNIDSELNEEIISSNSIKLEWWGRTTPYSTKKLVKCK